MIKDTVYSRSPGLHRRTFLKAAGIAVGLPLLDAMKQISHAAAPGDKGPGATGRRLVAVSYNLGFYPPAFFPEQAGKDYTPSEYLKVLDGLRDDFTVISGMSHLDVRGGHEAEPCFLTGAPYPRQPFKNSISLDQLLAQQMVGVTREPYLVLSTRPNGNAGMTGGISYTSGGTVIPGIGSPATLFARLFLNGGKDGVTAQKEKLARGQSILDAVSGQAGRLRRDIGPGDRDKLNEYLESVRDLEMRMQAAGAWADRPKPVVDVKPPVDQPEPNKILERMRLMYDMVHLALQTDSTRVISLFCADGGGIPEIAGVSQEHHDLTHHSQVAEKITQLRLHELAEMEVIRDFLTKLKATREGDSTLLDKTTLLFGSHLGDAGKHISQNLPLIVAGGGYKHAGHLAFDRKQNRSLSNLFVTMLQRTGMEIDKFAGVTGTMTGLDWKD
jgi:hypothetical protein